MSFSRLSHGAIECLGFSPVRVILPIRFRAPGFAFLLFFFIFFIASFQDLRSSYFFYFSTWHITKIIIADIRAIVSLWTYLEGKAPFSVLIKPFCFEPTGLIRTVWPEKNTRMAML